MISTDHLTQSEILNNTLDPNPNFQEFTNTFVKERLAQASKNNRGFCSYYDKLSNVGWIIGHNNIFFFQYLSGQSHVNKSFIEFPKGQRLESADHVRIFKRERDLYAIIIYQTMIQVTKILASDEEKSLVEYVRFSKDGEKISAISEISDEITSLSFTITTNKNSIYLVEIESKVIDLRLTFAITTQIFTRKIKFIQKLNQKIKTYTGINLESEVDSTQQAFCNMQRKTTDLTRGSIHNYEVLSFVGGKLELFSINLELKNGKYILSSNIHKWAVNFRSMLEGKLSEKLYQTHKKLWDFKVLDFKPEVIKNSSLILIRLVLRIELVNHSFLEGYFSYITLTLDDVKGNITKFEETPLHEGFKIPVDALQNKEQIYYGKIIANLVNQDVCICTHFSLKPKDGMIETEDVQNTQVNLFTEIESYKVNSFTLPDKILGFGNYFDYENNEEDVLLVITENRPLKMKVLKHINLSMSVSKQRHSGTSLAQSSRIIKQIKPVDSDNIPQQINVESVKAFTVANKITSQFREMLSNARDNLPTVRIEVENILRNNRPKDVWEGLAAFTNEILSTKNRNMMLVSTFVSSKIPDHKENSVEEADILLHEMKKKLKFLNTWIDFLQKFNLFDTEHPIQELAYSNREKLLAAIKLRETQISFNNLPTDDNLIGGRKILLFHAIMSCIEKWGLRAQPDSNHINNDIFYTKAENFADFISGLIEVYQTSMNYKTSTQNLDFLSQLIIQIFDTLYQERDTHNYEGLILWTHDGALLDSLFSLMQLNLKALNGVELNSEQMKENLTRLCYILIREYHHMQTIHPGDNAWTLKLEQVYNALFETKLFSQAGKFAEEFVHMDMLARLYYQYNYDHHIKDLFIRWNHLNFLKIFIDNYIKFLGKNYKTVKGPFKLFLDFEEFTPEITDYISKKYPQVAWIFLLKNGQFHIGENIIQKISEKENLLRNRLAEASAARLCTSFYNKEASINYDRLLRIDLIQNQNTVEAEILPPEQIIDNLLNKDKGRAASERIRGAIKVLANLPRNPYYKEVATNYDKLFNKVLHKAIEFDKTYIDDISRSLDMGQSSAIINDKVSRTCLWHNFDDLWMLVDREGIDLDNIVNGITGGNDKVNTVIQQIRTIKDTQRVNNYSESLGL